MNMPCAVTADLSRHLAQCEESDSFDEAVDALIEELTEPGAKFDGLGWAARSEALSEASPLFWSLLDDAIRSGYRKAASLIRAEVSGYWLTLATARAEQEIRARSMGRTYR